MRDYLDGVVIKQTDRGFLFETEPKEYPLKNHAPDPRYDYAICECEVPLTKALILPLGTHYFRCRKCGLEGTLNIKLEGIK